MGIFFIWLSIFWQLLKKKNTAGASFKMRTQFQLQEGQWAIIFHTGIEIHLCKWAYIETTLLIASWEGTGVGKYSLKITCTLNYSIPCSVPLLLSCPRTEGREEQWLLLVLPVPPPGSLHLRPGSCWKSEQASLLPSFFSGCCAGKHCAKFSRWGWINI